MRHDGRAEDELRPLDLLPGFVETADGSVLFSIGRTRVICTASIDADTPRWLRGTGRGWVSAEYGMLPASTGQRKQRDSSRGRPDGRSIEIQRLIGRSLRAIVDLQALGERTVWVDCDVLQADGGTRCASICGGYVALHRALGALVDAGTLSALPLTAGVAAVSCGIVEGEAVLDLDYKEDSSAEVDLNVVMTSGGRLVEVQGTAEGQPFDRAQLDRLLELGAAGMQRIEAAQLAGGRRPAMSRLRAVLATGNAGKAAELSRLLGADVEARAIDVAEDADSYAGNALLKARAALADAGGLIGLGDDSGIEVAALGGEPGLRSARWTGPGDADRNAALLARIARAADRSATFVCVLAAALPDGREIARGGPGRGRPRAGPARRRGLWLRPALRAPRRHAHGRRALAGREGRRLAPRPRSPGARGSALRGGRDVNAAALLLPFVVALPPGAGAPPPGSLPQAARITVLDRQLGLVAVRLPQRGIARTLVRLRAAPGVRYVERDAPVRLASTPEGCLTVGEESEPPDPGWRTAIHLSRRSAAGMLIGIADSGVDDDRLAPRQVPLVFRASGGLGRPGDPLGHGTAVASLLVANRPDVGVVGIVPDATLLSSRIVNQGSCSQSVLEHGLIASFGWLRREGAQVVNVSATATPSRALIESLRALQLSGALVVAAVGNGGAIAGRDAFPASQPGVLGVGALAPGSATVVYSRSTRGKQVDLVAPDEGIKVIASGDHRRASRRSSRLPERRSRRRS